MHNTAKPDFTALDRGVAQTRVVLSVVVLLSIYVDPSTGGLFHVNRWQFLTLVCHFIYSALMYLALRRSAHLPFLHRISTTLDLAFATALAFVTEGLTSPSFVFFVFAIVAVGLRASFRHLLMTTVCSVALYILVIALSSNLMGVYLMRPVYLAIAGFLIGVFGQQRMNFETQLHEQETQSERLAIARSLHDGYIQALAGISLRLESCLDTVRSAQPIEAVDEINELQAVVGYEYDQVREYVRSLANVDPLARDHTVAEPDTQFKVQAAFGGRGATIEHIMQIALEGVRNTLRHGHAHLAAINVEQVDEAIRITIDDDGVGFISPINPPWTIASRVMEFGGRFAISSELPGAHIIISIPTT